MSDPVVSGIYNPETGKVACVLLQAAFGHSTSLPHLFDVRDWATHPESGMIALEAPRSVWEKIASMPREERIQSYKEFAGCSR